jgi:hypothetical protein
MRKKVVVKIRFNTYFKEGDVKVKEWRVIINGVENFCNHVSINCPSKTTKDFMEGVGYKWHISCEPKHIDYIKDERITDNSGNLFEEIILS